MFCCAPVGELASEEVVPEPQKPPKKVQVEEDERASTDVPGDTELEFVAEGRSSTPWAAWSEPPEKEVEILGVEPPEKEVEILGVEALEITANLDQLTPAPDIEASPEIAAARQAFAGTWRLERVDGDMDACLADMGYNIAFRKILAALKWGCGVVKLSFAVDDERTVLTQVTPGGTYVQELQMDNKRASTPLRKQFSKDLANGKKIELTPFWDGATLVVMYEASTTRFDVVDGYVVATQTTRKSGVTVRVCYKQA